MLHDSCMAECNDGLDGMCGLAPEPGSYGQAPDGNVSGDPVLLVTDVVLPGMNGHELAERVISRRPGTKMLYISAARTTPSFATVCRNLR